MLKHLDISWDIRIFVVVKVARDRIVLNANKTTSTRFCELLS